MMMMLMVDNHHHHYLNYQDSSDNTGPWYAYEQVYYSVNTFPSLTVDYKDFTVATTQAAAEAG